MYLYEVGTGLSVLINQGVLISGCPLRKVPVYVPCNLGICTIQELCSAFSESK